MSRKDDPYPGIARVLLGARERIASEDDRYLETARVLVGVRKRIAERDQKLDELTKTELLKRAAAADIRGRSRMTKPELIRALKAEGRAQEVASRQGLRRAGGGDS